MGAAGSSTSSRAPRSRAASRISSAAPRPSLPPLSDRYWPIGEWNEYEIRVRAQLYTVMLNGELACRFDNTTLYPKRGLPSTSKTPTYIGLQAYPNPRYRVAFRRIRIKAL